MPLPRRWVAAIVPLIAVWPAQAEVPQEHAAERAAARTAVVRRIDELVGAKIKAAGMEPAGRAGDEEFVRRVYLDLTGAIPRVAEARAFLADERPDKRAKLIDALLDSPAHATHLANTWRNIMLPGGLNLEQINNLVGVQNWLRQRFVDNVRFDNLVSELLVASDGGEVGPALYYTSLDVAPEKLAGSTARIFLGVQIECAQCHDHPFDHWKQRDFWGYAAFFARLRQPEMNNPGMRRARLVDLDMGEVKLPKTEEVVLPKYPGGVSPRKDELGTRREQLAIWMASRDNPFLARAGVNRVWWHLFGRGLVEPVDDLGPQNRPSHPELLDELTAYFVQTGFDLRELYRALANTDAYQRTSTWTAEPSPPPELLVHMPLKTLTAEQLYDSVNRVLHRQPQTMMAGVNVASPLLDPQRQAFIAKVQSSGRNSLEYQAGVLQALALLNGNDLAEATDPAKSPLLGSLQAPFFTDDDRLRALFLATFSRQPVEEELSLCRQQVAKYAESDRSKAYGDVLWVLLNSAEFALNH
jgi:Protein of unknown function (DUF1549)/Protein of unknown function (DUF1553)